MTICAHVKMNGGSDSPSLCCRPVPPSSRRLPCATKNTRTNNTSGPLGKATASSSHLLSRRRRRCWTVLLIRHCEIVSGKVPSLDNFNWSWLTRSSSLETRLPDGKQRRIRACIAVQKMKLTNEKKSYKERDGNFSIPVF